MALMQVGVSEAEGMDTELTGGVRGYWEKTNDKLLNSKGRTAFRRGVLQLCGSIKITNVHLPPIHVCASNYTESSVL